MNKFNEIINIYQKDLQEVDEIIINSSVGKSNLIQEITQNLVGSGGKRIRPILLVICAKLCGYNNSKITNLLASSVELIHTATLLHDDVVDESQIRRGKKTANAIFDNKASILVGDYLFSLSFQHMVQSKNLAVLKLLATTSSIIADGEVLQLQNSSNIEITEEQYFEIIYGKTGALFSACCEVGGILAELSENKVNALRNFGKNLGMLFQIIDDILDYSSSQWVIGKDLGNDFFEGKVTLPIIKTYQNCDLATKKLIKDFFSFNYQNNEKNYQNFEKILEIMNDCNGLKMAKEKALLLYLQAKNNLEVFEDNIYKNHLITILDYSLNRIS
ncbi:MAG: polyprenyl synthetase family protein [Rickettsiales bacterium]